MADIDRLLARGNALVDCFWRAAPKDIESSGRFDEWAIVGPALLARCAYLFETALVLVHRDLDAAIITRCLWDHAVAFSWIAIDPAERLPPWVEYERQQRAKLNEGAGALATYDQPYGALADFAAIYGHAEGHPWPSSPLGRAKEVDAHYRAALPEAFGNDRRFSFEAQYHVLFRGLSAYVHPRLLLLNRFVGGDRSRQRICRPSSVPEGVMPLSFAVAVFANTVAASWVTMGWPERDAIWRAQAQRVARPTSVDVCSHAPLRSLLV